jgi:UDP-N-acetylmuramoylalanine--D-glutamate ligase
MNFSERILLPKKPAKVPDEILNETLKALHLILGISYYKLYCPEKIILKNPLSKAQAEFWNTVYTKGLGEFFYRNKIWPKIKFPFKKIKVVASKFERQNRALLGIGGGKDSIVAGELLKEDGLDLTGFLVETEKSSPITENVIKVMGIPSLKIERFLDAKIFEKHEGAYNGHVPISAVFAFTGLLSALLYDYKYIVVANEHSSDFGNIKYKGVSINHQWSKSSEFEALFQNYVSKFITPDIIYFSAIRQFYEIRVVEIFTKYKKYFPHFSSCNRNFKVYKKRSDSLWCGECAKCAFVFAQLAAFLPKKEVVEMFGKNLFADEKLLPMYRDLLGLGKLKPFDCVGTFEETNTAISMAAEKFKNDIVVKKFKAKYSADVFKTYAAPTLPTEFKLLGLKNVLIVGYGREGKITEKFLKKFYPHLKITIADQALDKNYLSKQKDFDFAIKTPGVQKNLIKIPYTTATNLFFSRVKNTTIGVTGSKGKSTTASLIYSILKEGGKKVRLLGNIGAPMLEALLETPKKDEIFVLEMSSYQLDDIEYSPDISVVTNLFPEHMNYHGSIENYYEAKKNIIKKSGLFVCNLKNKMVKKWGEEVTSIPFAEEIRGLEIPLLGEHNRENIRAAIAVAKQFKISDAIIKRAIKSFKPLPHRLELVGEFHGIKFYDDAISTTPESTIEALKALPKTATIFLGGQDRGYDFSQLEKVLRKSKVKNIALFPNSGKRILKSRKGFNILETSSLKEAVKFAHENTAKGGICLLSMASPSYVLWKNFEEKGDEFQRVVKSL